MSLFLSILYHCRFLFYTDSILCVFLPDGVFLPCNYGLDFDISLCENSINQSIKYEDTYFARNTRAAAHAIRMIEAMLGEPFRRI